MTDRTQQIKSICCTGLEDIASLGIWDTLQLSRLNSPCRYFCSGFNCFFLLEYQCIRKVA